MDSENPALRKWRSLVRVSGIDRESNTAWFTIPSWSVRKQIPVALDTVPAHVDLEEDFRFNALVNTGAEHMKDIRIEWIPLEEIGIIAAVVRKDDDHNEAVREILRAYFGGCPSHYGTCSPEKGESFHEMLLRVPDNKNFYPVITRENTLISWAYTLNILHRWVWAKKRMGIIIEEKRSLDGITIAKFAKNLATGEIYKDRRDFR